MLTVLTHENRPPMANKDEGYKDDVAPDGSPYRPLYDGKILFDGQPVAVVVAETSEAARYAASLVQVEYEKQPHATDIYGERDAAVPIKTPTSPLEAAFSPPKRRGNPEQALAAAAVRHEAEYYVPIEHHNPMELYASTVIYEASGKLTVYDKTQGVQNVHRYLCSVFGMKPRGSACDVAVHGRRLWLGAAAAVPGGAGGACRARSQTVRAPGADAAADVCAGLPAGDDPAHRDRRQRRRNVGRDHA